MNNYMHPCNNTSFPFPIPMLQDVSEAIEEEEQLKREEQMLREQELSNLLHHKDYFRAVGVAISLDQPFRVLKILQGQQYSSILKNVKQ